MNISKTKSRYIRCIKPNTSKVPYHIHYRNLKLQIVMNDRCIHLLLENQEYILELVCLNILKINELKEENDGQYIAKQRQYIVNLELEIEKLSKNSRVDIQTTNIAKGLKRYNEEK